jgi:8-amino-7-oxononanoate synthase
MLHPSRVLRPWDQLTTGVPSALAEHPDAGRLAQSLAALIGCDRATLAPSTLHLFWDLFGILTRQPVVIYVDSGVYPVARFGVERAAARGVTVRTFPHLDLGALRAFLARDAGLNLKPLVVTDGFCPGCGRVPAIRSYIELVRAFNGQLIMDDTQAIGILGHSASPVHPYGLGGGGSLRLCDSRSPEVVVINSLAKGLGVPIAALGGAKDFVRHFERQSEIRVHCSPPSLAALHALDRALELNEQEGDDLRLRLAVLVRQFRERASRAGFALRRALFPVQTLRLDPGFRATALHRRLLDAGVKTVLHRERRDHPASISFLITVNHTPAEIDRAGDALVASRASANRRPRQ